MALRKIRLQGDEVLAKVSRPVEKMTPRIHDLIGDMLETMYDAMGVGLAAPQVGMLKRIVVIDIGEGPIVLINPDTNASTTKSTHPMAILPANAKPNIHSTPITGSIVDNNFDI